MKITITGTTNKSESSSIPDGDRFSIAENILGAIRWEGDGTGYCECPGKHLHTHRDGEKDCKVYLSEVPTIRCFHQSCEGHVQSANQALRSAIGKLEFKKEKSIDAPKAVISKREKIQSKFADIAKRTDWIRSHSLEETDLLPETQSEHFLAHLSLFESQENIWHGDFVCSDSFFRVQQLLRNPKPIGEFISHSSFQADAHARTNDNVEAVRYLVVESDTLAKPEQRAVLAWLRDHCGWNLRLVLDTAGKSLHGWFDWPKNIDRNELKDLLIQLKCDARLLTDSQPSRVAGAIRIAKEPGQAKGLQRIVWIGGIPDIDEEGNLDWSSIIWNQKPEEKTVNDIVEPVKPELLSDDFGIEYPIDDLLSFDTDNDPTTLLGKRFLCQKGSMQIVGESGIGKSSLFMQAAMCWSLGRDFFGIEPARPLKILLCQRENDAGDIAEEIQGVFKHLGLDEEGRSILRKRLRIVQSTVGSGAQWIKWVQKKVEAHGADLLFVDPLMAFVDGDISKAQDATYFLRHLLQPMLNATGCAIVAVHHAGKPMKDMDKNTLGAYLGIGSSEFTNYFRAIMTLTRDSEIKDQFVLRGVKRGKRAGMKSFDGNEKVDLVTEVKLKYGSEGICWEQCVTSKVDSSKQTITIKGAREIKPKSKNQCKYMEAGINYMPKIWHNYGDPSDSPLLKWIAEKLDLGVEDSFSGLKVFDMHIALEEFNKIRRIGLHEGSKTPRIIKSIKGGYWQGNDFAGEFNE